jgi:hypothetical protein
MSCCKSCEKSGGKCNPPIMNRPWQPVREKISCCDDCAAGRSCSCTGQDLMDMGMNVHRENWLQGVGLGQIAAMTPGQQITAGQSLWSSTNNHQLIMQTDGNLVIYDQGGQPIWASNTRGSGGVRAIMQTDGNFVIYKSYTSSSPSEAVWASGTYGHPGAWITMQNDGNLVIYTPIQPANPNVYGSQPSDRPLWASDNSTSAADNNNILSSFGIGDTSDVNRRPPRRAPVHRLALGDPTAPAPAPSNTTTYAVVGASALAVGLLGAILYERSKKH